MLRMICRVPLKEMVESTVIASRVGVDDLEEHLRQKRLRWFENIVRTDQEVEITSVGVENRKMQKERQASEMMD